MKKDYRERVMHKCLAMAKKNKLMKYPSLAVMMGLLSIYYIYRHFATNGKRYAGIAFSILFFVSSCSFSFAVFTGQQGFINTQETYNEIIEYYDVEFAVEKEIGFDGNIIPEKEEVINEHDLSEDMESTDSYTLDDILEGTEGYSIGDVDQGSTTSGTEEEPVFDSSDWRLVLVNKQHPIPEDYSFNLGTIKGTKGNMKCDERIIADLLNMLQAAKDDGINLVVQSPYRTYSRQELLFSQKISRYMAQGYSYMEAYKTASQIVTIPGSSEHQIGLALDISSDTYNALEQGFADTEAGKWLAEHSYEYGFILRYPEGKEYITGIEFEPWHFRYVGKDAATVMMQDDICLEEFWDKYL